MHHSIGGNRHGDVKQRPIDKYGAAGREILNGKRFQRTSWLMP